MLVLSRYIGQSLFIGDDVEIKVLGVRGDQVKVGVSAPKDIMVLREELRKPARATSQVNGQSSVKGQVGDV